VAIDQPTVENMNKESIRAFRRRIAAKVAGAIVRATTRVSSRHDLERLGSAYGGWWIPTELVNADSIVYSAGVGEDATFDLDLINRFGCDVWALDPTPRSIEFAKQIGHPQFHFLPVGIWSEDAELRFYAPTNSDHVSHSILNIQRTHRFFTAQCVSLPTLMSELGHDHIDVLKMDIEGAEGPVLDAMLRNGINPRVLCVEFDAVEAPWRLRGRLRQLVRAGFVVRHIEDRNYTFTSERQW
jgi:FkbM family methyltransferase